MARIVYNVPYIRQSGGNDCWAASVAMILGKSVGKGSAQLSASGGLRISEENLAHFASSHGLKMLPEGSQSNAIDKITDLLRGGPILVGGKLSRPGGHAFVIAGVDQDKVLILDPSSRGGKGWVNYSTLMTKYPFATAIMMQKEKLSPQVTTPGARQLGTSSLLRRGSRGTEVMDIQKRLRLKPDGIFGPKTEAAVIDLQRRNGLRIDGIVGLQTRPHLPSTPSILPQGVPPLGGSSLLRRGSRGPEVIDLQKRLGLKSDGIYGPKTETAVIDLQRRNGLRIDGIVGPQTRPHLPSTPSILPQGVPPLGGSPLLRRGSRGPEVIGLQKRLGLKSDGIYGPKTETAVIDLQRRNGIRIDGIVGPQTRGAMQTPKGSVDFGPLTIRYPGHEPVTISAGWDRESNLLRRGSRGTEVMGIQKRLGLKPDGIFGPKTEAAVFDFQRRNGLRTDGIVGPQTRGCFNDPLRAALRQLR